MWFPGSRGCSPILPLLARHLLNSLGPRLLFRVHDLLQDCPGRAFMSQSVDHGYGAQVYDSHCGKRTTRSRPAALDKL